MRAPFTSLLLAALLLSVSSSFGITKKDGRIVRGPYTASGSVSAPGLTVRYLPSKVGVNSYGRVRGKLARQVISNNGAVLQSSIVAITGKIRSIHIRVKKGTFTAPAVLHIADGAVFHGSFSGLAASDQKPSRYFRGKINGNKNSNLLLRSR